MLFPITTLTAVILAFWFLILSFRVIGARRVSGPDADEATKTTLERRIRGHGNFAEYVPFALVLLMLAESQSAPGYVSATGAILLVAGRMLHGYAFSFTEHWVFGRLVGMITTFGSILVLALANLAVLIASAG